MITLKEKERILELYEKGASIIEIANQLGLDRHTVAKIINEYNSNKTAEKPSLKEFSTIEDAKENIIGMIPGIVRMIRSDSEIERGFAREGTFVENPAERKLMAGI